MPRGRIKFFNEAKGYGFIEADEGSLEAGVYVHHSQIAQPGYRTLKEGEAVEFDLREGSSGLEAVNVQRLP
jgi:CspA family cold shock protein